MMSDPDEILSFCGISYTMKEGKEGFSFKLTYGWLHKPRNSFGEFAVFTSDVVDAFFLLKVWNQAQPQRWVYWPI